MKNFRILFYVTSFFVLSSTSMMASNPETATLNHIEENEAAAAIFTDNSPVGTWNYTVNDAPYEYSSGILYVTKEKSGYAVKVKLNYSTEVANNVTVNKNKLDFSIIVEGLTVKVALEVDANGIKGKADSPEGVFSLTGKRSKK